MEEDNKELRMITTGPNGRALITIPTALPLATVMELEGRCQAATTAQSERSSENIFKAIDDRLSRLERARMETEELRGQLDGIARILVNMAGRQQRNNYERLPMASHFGGSVGRYEFYSVILMMLLFILSALYVYGKSGRSTDRHRNHSHEHVHTPQPPQSPVPLDLPNSDYLGMSRTPVSGSGDSGERGHSPRRRQSLKP